MPEVLLLPIAALAPSAGNPRKRIRPEELAELSESIRQFGVLHPIIVRPNAKASGAYDIITGERRWLAARQAGYFSVPCIVRDGLTPEDIVALQAVENLHRADLHPIEETESYRILRDEHGKPVEEIARLVGKSRAYVFRRLQLATLLPEAREAFLGGRLSAPVALLIARMPTEDGQRLVFSEVDVPVGADPMPYAAARQVVMRNVLRRLDDAPFSTEDAEVTPGTGPCHACPRRAERIGGLFEDEQGENLCVDPVCYAAKSAAASVRNGARRPTGAAARRRELTSHQRRTRLRHATEHRMFEIMRDQAVECVEKTDRLPDQFWVALVLSLAGHGSAVEVFAQRGLPDRPTAAEVEELKPRELRSLVLELALGIAGPQGSDRILPVVAEGFGLNVEDARERARDEALADLPARKTKRAAEPASEASG